LGGGTRILVHDERGNRTHRRISSNHALFQRVDQYTSYSNNAETQTPPDNTTHYASINDMYGNIRIKTPEDTYKLSDKVTIDTLQQQQRKHRNAKTI
jgi:hypothetical protein